MISLGEPRPPSELDYKTQLRDTFNKQRKLNKEMLIAPEAEYLAEL
jgi:hypothetical protein